MRVAMLVVLVMSLLLLGSGLGCEKRIHEASHPATSAN